MSEKQYEAYMVKCFLEWVSADIQPGCRYQFKSPDSDNSLALYHELLNKTSLDRIEFEGQKLAYIDCAGTQLIPVLHGSGADAYTENYISHLRDCIAGRSEPFARSSMLFIHNSMLDTLINSAMDLAGPGAIWHPKTLEKELGKLIDISSNKAALLRCLLDNQLAVILEEGATVFGFSPLFETLNGGVLDFSELGLLNDPVIENMSIQPYQVKNRLDENRELRKQIDFNLMHFGDQLDGVLKQFSPKFIKEHFEDKKDWQQLPYNDYLEEIKANKLQKLIFERASVFDATLEQRNKSSTKAGQKEISLLIQPVAGKNEVLLELVFAGNDLEKNQIRIAHNKQLQKDVEIEVSRAGGKYSRVKAHIPFSHAPCFFSIELKRDNRSEEYRFRCLILEAGRFYLDEIKNAFRIEPQKNQITLQLEENSLRLAPSGDSVYTLNEDAADVDCQQFHLIDFDQLANQSEMIRFSLCSGTHRLDVNVEGPGAEDGVNIPLLFDLERITKSLLDDENAEYNRLKNKVVLDNIEHSIVGTRQQLLDYEADLIDQNLLHASNGFNLSIADLASHYPSLLKTYENLYSYYRQRKTLPSLVAWGEDYCFLVKEVLDAFENELRSIPLNQVLSRNQRNLLQIGIHNVDGKERLSPIHPLVLAYHHQLVGAIRSERADLGSNSFYSLPDVTLDRLVASGLLPYTYHSDSEFANLIPVKENRFWLDLIPQRKVSHSYVRRLVKDKLAEFSNAYSRLFTSGVNSSLIINAINQARAEEIFLGLVDHFRSEKGSIGSIHVNFYDDSLIENNFDLFSEISSYEEAKHWLGLSTSALRADADTLIDQLRSRLTYSKFTFPKDEGENLHYAHLAFFSNSVPVECHPVNIETALSGVLCQGLISGEAAETMNDAYFTAFGLRNVDCTEVQSLRISNLIGSLWQPSRQPNAQYLGTGIGLAVSANFKKLLTRSYDSALWTTIIDPKVTLDFFTSQKDVVLIHYSDQYTSSAGYDAITVTKQIDLFQRLLKVSDNVGSDRLLSEFNAFNGEWLLKMMTSNAKDRKEKQGIIGAYKFVNAMLSQSDICWVPLSVAEMIRVSGNVGLKMTDSDFTRHLKGYKSGAISDDVLFVGFKNDSLFLLPLEVKTGARPNFSYAEQQAKELKRYLQDEVLGPGTLASSLYRALFVRQILIQVEKFKLYNVITDKNMDPLLSRREWWLKGEYKIDNLPNYIDGIVLAHIDSDSCVEPKYTLTSANILEVELPYSLLSALISADTPVAIKNLIDKLGIPSEYLLKRFSHKNYVLPSDEGIAQDSPIPPKTVTSATGSPLYSIAQTNEQVDLRILFGHDVLRQEPIYWEPTNTAKFMNTNTGIIGTMGTGKTQFTKSIITQLVANQTSNVNSASIGLLIFDYKSDYVDQAFVKANNAKAFKLDRLPYNPLSLYGDMPKLPVHTATGFSETMAKAFGLGQKQQLKLKKLILDAYEKKGISALDSSSWAKSAPTIADVWELFVSSDKVEHDSLYAALDSLVSYEIFESVSDRAGSLYDLLDGVVVIELAGYTPQIQNLVVALTLDLFYSQMQKFGKPSVCGDHRQITKMILVDEADNFMKEDFQSLRKILKEGREYGVGLILSTQELTHFKTGDNNYASYILTWVIHRVAEIKTSDIRAIFNKDDRQEQERLMEVTRKLDKHYSLYIDGNKKVVKMKDMAFWQLKLISASE
ncbi:DNA phosphorothioation-dependent restriction protein DptH [Pseudomonas sp. C6002]|uniref:DNA phosphorothioation-dependent restriction protein DptH n=1 Tax=Pseudomonas sp. C6002 TaxID=2738814 RepID=UPI0015A1D8C5|nr:DNA phosphorothioation-dependent restriction protein DptH [Pseudomonas sp. C6002]NWA32033.1 DNA phosphorothioation-dependent restriction protein DptH [Pseudomonas sp. C6002]